MCLQFCLFTFIELNTYVSLRLSIFNLGIYLSYMYSLNFVLNLSFAVINVCKYLLCCLWCQAWRSEGLPLSTTSHRAAKLFDAVVTQVLYTIHSLVLFVSNMKFHSAHAGWIILLIGQISKASNILRYIIDYAVYHRICPKLSYGHGITDKDFWLRPIVHPLHL